VQEALQLGEEALEACDSARVVCLTVVFHYTSVLCLNADRGGPAEHRDKAERMCRGALAVCVVGHPLRVKILRSLGSILARRCELTRELQYVDEAIRLQRVVLAEVSSLPGEHQEQLGIEHHALANHLKKRYQFLQDPNDLEDAICNYKASLTLCPAAHKNLALLQARVSQSLGCRFQEKGRLEDLNEALIIGQQSLLTCGPQSAVRSYSLNVVAGLLRLRFTYTSASDSDLSAMVALRREALRLSPPGHYEYPGCLVNLANALHEQFLWTGHLGDLEEAIQLRREDPRKTTLKPGEELTSDINLAEDLCLRFQETSRRHDIYEAIHIYRCLATFATKTSHYRRHIFVLPMVSALCIKFDLEHLVEDLDEAISLAQDYVGDMSDDHHLLFSATQLLCQALALRGRQKEDIRDLDMTIELLERNQNPGVIESASGAAYFRTLATSLLYRFRLNGKIEDIDRTKELMLEQLSRTPSGRRDRFQSLIDLAELYLERGSGFYDSSVALTYLTQAIGDHHRDVRSRLKGTTRLLGIIEANCPDILAFQTPQRTQLLDVYASAIALLPHVAYFGLDPTARLESLGLGQSVATMGATLALRLCQPEKAVEMIEQGRAVFWTHALHLRSDFQDVPEGIRDRLTAIARNLEKKNDISYSSSDQRLIDKAITQRRQQSDEFSALVEQVRAIPGLHRFMLCHEFSALSQVARGGPVVVLIANSVACYAVVIQGPGHVSSIPLPSLTETWVISSGKRWRSAAEDARSAGTTRLNVVKKKNHQFNPKSMADDVLDGLWTKVVSPVLSILELKVRTDIVLFFCTADMLPL
jgi:tetratricopeptide (TPR) repeat protein